jgi:hypothetical protein
MSTNAVGSGEWIGKETVIAKELVYGEIEDFTYFARQELEWLNECMNGLTGSNDYKDMATLMQTPGRLKGVVSPRKARLNQLLGNQNKENALTSKQLAQSTPLTKDHHLVSTLKLPNPQIEVMSGPNNRPVAPEPVQEQSDEEEDVESSFLAISRSIRKTHVVNSSPALGVSPSTTPNIDNQAKVESKSTLKHVDFNKLVADSNLVTDAILAVDSERLDSKVTAGDSDSESGSSDTTPNRKTFGFASLPTREPLTKKSLSKGPIESKDDRPISGWSKQDPPVDANDDVERKNAIEEMKHNLKPFKQQVSTNWTKQESPDHFLIQSSTLSSPPIRPRQRKADEDASEPRPGTAVGTTIVPENLNVHPNERTEPPAILLPNLPLIEAKLGDKRNSIGGKKVEKLESKLQPKPVVVIQPSRTETIALTTHSSPRKNDGEASSLISRTANVLRLAKNLLFEPSDGKKKTKIEPDPKLITTTKSDTLLRLMAPTYASTSRKNNGSPTRVISDSSPTKPQPSLNKAVSPLTGKSQNPYPDVAQMLFETQSPKKMTKPGQQEETAGEKRLSGSCTASTKTGVKLTKQTLQPKAAPAASRQKLVAKEPAKVVQTPRGQPVPNTSVAAAPTKPKRGPPAKAKDKPPSKPASVHPVVKQVASKQTTDPLAKTDRPPGRPPGVRNEAAKRTSEQAFGTPLPEKATTLAGARSASKTITTAEPPVKKPSFTSHAKLSSSLMKSTLIQQAKALPGPQVDGVKFSNDKIRFAGGSKLSSSNPFRPIPSISSLINSSLTPKEKPSHAPETILPDIMSESEDDDDSNVLQDWANSPQLRDILLRQQTVDPDNVFGPIPPLQMDEVFRSSRVSRFRPRSSSANWSGHDKLTQQEIDNYAQEMGYRATDK